MGDRRRRRSRRRRSCCSIIQRPGVRGPSQRGCCLRWIARRRSRSRRLPDRSVATPSRTSGGVDGVHRTPTGPARVGPQSADHKADARESALVDFCQVLSCLNEFVYVIESVDDLCGLTMRTLPRFSVRPARFGSRREFLTRAGNGSACWLGGLLQDQGSSARRPPDGRSAQSACPPRRTFSGEGAVRDLAVMNGDQASRYLGLQTRTRRATDRPCPASTKTPDSSRPGRR